ncbi:hypothetical protein EV127DRAFT_503339 [Xylaria flabelliformis]|nr:hypothetical protein EV127DRAFT_503339 [Xylaria flabelliformis]
MAPRRSLAKRAPPTHTIQYYQIDDPRNHVPRYQNPEHAAVNLVQAEARAEAQSKTQALHEVKKELEDTKTKLDEYIILAEEGKMAAREAKATEMGRTIIVILKEMKITGTQNWTGGTPSYAAMAFRGLATSTHNIQVAKSTNMQAQREIIVNIRDPLTVAKHYFIPY